MMSSHLRPRSSCTDNDTLVFIDFRADRMRQIVEALGIKPQFEVDVIPKGLSLVTMTEYKDVFPFPVLFPQEVPTNTLAEWLAKKDLPQFHCAGRLLLPLLVGASQCALIGGGGLMSGAQASCQGSRLERIFSCRDGEVCSCHLFLQRRPRAAALKGGQEAGPFPQSRDL